MPHDLRSLQAQHSAPGLTIRADEQGLVHLLVHVGVSTRVAAARIYLQGAHVTHYQPAGAAPVLFISEHSLYQTGKPIRGGVPLVFPWFGPHPDDASKPAHGWARSATWELDHVTRESEDAMTLSFSLRQDVCALTYTVRVGPDLRMELAVVNTGAAPATFEEALHTYLAVGDV